MFHVGHFLCSFSADLIPALSLSNSIIIQSDSLLVASITSSGICVFSDDGAIATYPISCNAITSFYDFVTISCFVFLACSHPCISYALQVVLHLSILFSLSGLYIFSELNILYTYIGHLTEYLNLHLSPTIYSDIGATLYSSSVSTDIPYCFQYSISVFIHLFLFTPIFAPFLLGEYLYTSLLQSTFISFLKPFTASL